MKTRSFTVKKASLALLCAFAILIALQCKKEGKNASSLDRSVKSSDLDTTIFISFYDTAYLNIATTNAANDTIAGTGLQSIVLKNCSTTGCHGGTISPTILTYNDIKSLVKPGDPENSKLWQLVTTHDLNKAMPPVATVPDIPISAKVAIYDWIKNGANETPVLADFKPHALKIITGGCTAACHNESLAVGAWARTFNLGRELTSADTTTGRSNSNLTGCISINDTLTERVWSEYKDSVTKFYADTLANQSFMPVKTIGSALGPLSSYENIVFDTYYPKGKRTVNNPFVSATASNNIITRIDGTLTFITPGTQAPSTSGSMGSTYGHYSSSEIAIIKGWYFNDPTIPDLWKYGDNNTGIFRDIGGNMITKK
jgi:hypothetical protein